MHPVKCLHFGEPKDCLLCRVENFRGQSEKNKSCDINIKFPIEFTCLQLLMEVAIKSKIKLKEEME